jgi:hypothetical protein
MAVYTLPNGSEYNTGYSFLEQPDSGSYEFMAQVETANTPICTYLSGSNPNIPRVKTKTLTETGYPDYDYIRKTEFGYTDNTYTRQSVTETFEIQSK